MPKNSQKTIESRRDQVWHLLLKGYNPQLIKSELNIPRTTIYRDIECLTNRSKQYMYDLGKGLHVLSYQRAIEGIGLTLSQAWDKFNDPQVPEKQKVAYLRLTRECNESLMQLTIDGPSIMAIENLKKKIENAGINISNLNLNDISDNSSDSSSSRYNDRRG